MVADTAFLIYVPISIYLIHTCLSKSRPRSSVFTWISGGKITCRDISTRLGGMMEVLIFAWYVVWGWVGGVEVVRMGMSRRVGEY